LTAVHAMFMASGEPPDVVFGEGLAR